jgi:excinuclease UvrABC nuclease subunit
MIEFAKKDFKEQNIPEQSGIFTFSDAEKKLYIGKTSNLKKSLNNIFSLNPENEVLFKLVSLTEKISFTEYPSLFLALIEQKKLLDKFLSEYNILLKQHLDYVYLAIDFTRVPYFKVVENTQENLYYFGPFRDRIFLYDLLDTMGELFQFPVCEDEKYPCQRLKDKKCYGWCVKDNTEIGKVIVDSYLQVNEKLTVELKAKEEELSKDLQFIKVEKLKKQITMIEKFYNQIKFLHTTKNLDLELNIEKTTIIINKGMITAIKEGSTFLHFPDISPQYRDNELLAFDKEQLSERWIIYSHLQKNRKKYLDKIYKNSVSEMIKKLQ